MKTTSARTILAAALVGALALANAHACRWKPGDIEKVN